MKMTCTLEFCNEISSEKRAEFLSQMTALGMSVSSAGGTFHLRCEEKYDEYLDSDAAVTTPPPQIKMMSNPHMMCMHHMCKRTGGHYKLNELPRKRYCVEHKPDDTYKTHQVFRREAATAASLLHLCDRPMPIPCFSDSSEKRKRDKDEDDDGWITVKH